MGILAYNKKREPQLLEVLFIKSGDDLLSHKPVYRFDNSCSERSREVWRSHTAWVAISRDCQMFAVPSALYREGGLTAWIDTNHCKKRESQFLGTLSKKVAMTYSPTNVCSTIGAVGLNFSVRDGKRWDPNAINRLNIGIRTFDEVQKSVHFFQVVLRKLLSLE